MISSIDTDNNINLQSITFCHYKLTIGPKEMSLTFPQLLVLRNRINALTESNSIEEIINLENFVLLFIADRKHLVYLDIPQLMSLKNEIDAFFFSPYSILT